MKGYYKTLKNYASPTTPRQAKFAGGVAKTVNTFITFDKKKRK